VLVPERGASSADNQPKRVCSGGRLASPDADNLLERQLVFLFNDGVDVGVEIVEHVEHYNCDIRYWLRKGRKGTVFSKLDLAYNPPVEANAPAVGGGPWWHPPTEPARAESCAPPQHNLILSNFSRYAARARAAGALSEADPRALYSCSAYSAPLAPRALITSARQIFPRARNFRRREIGENRL